MEVFSHQPIPIQLKRERKVWHNESFSHMLLAHLISGTCTWREKGLCLQRYDVAWH